MQTRQSRGFGVFLKFQHLAMGTKSGLWPQSPAQHLLLLVPGWWCNLRLLVPCSTGPCHLSPHLCLLDAWESFQCLAQHVTSCDPLMLLGGGIDFKFYR